MGLIREPLDVDFVVDPRPLSDKEKKMISDFIKADKENRKNKKTSKKGTYTQHAVIKHCADSGIFDRNNI